MLPLHALLSQVLVAFTIEFDNEFEHRMPHRTTNHGGSYGPWLGSLVLWANCMRFVNEEGISAKELEKRARTKTNLDGMQRWGYISIGADRLLRPTPAGRKAQEIWRPLDRAIEARWEERFGQQTIGNLREELSALVAQLDPAMPDCMPILGYGLWSGREVKAQAHPGDAAHPFYTLLSRPLLAFAEEFEARSPLSLAICANVLRVFDTDEIPVRELPTRSGISKEAIQVALGFLAKAGVIRLETLNRTKIASITERGIKAREEYRMLVKEIEKNWRARFGEKSIANLRATLEQLAGDRRAIEPYPDGWRAAVPRPATLPHFPAVTHRGGYPDGA